ncbi:Protein of unknown function DUF4246 [Penicillium expansum]|nr:Protein of unknown function DUF4246 [Penicillium expansum]KGO65196.1 Protein of unknown function DUF4246 [Penicillium expansum]
MASQNAQLPGFSLPLNFAPRRMFPSALQYEDLDMDIGRINVHQDVVMMRIINAFTEMPDWHSKIYESDDGALKELLRQTAGGEDVTPKMTSWIIKELQWKAENLLKTGYTFFLDPGVFKSDSMITASTTKALKEASRSLGPARGNSPPESKKMIFNPVEPSICPVIYGRTLTLPDQTIGVDDCVDKGQGVLLPIPLEEQAYDQLDNQTFDPAYDQAFYTFWLGRSKKVKPFSRRFQWLPCDVALGEDETCHITSYINNIPPWENRGLYETI